MQLNASDYTYDATVIILGYNGLRYIDGCLGSVLEQDFPAGRYEVIWADNGSRDGSANDVAERFPQVRLFRLGRNYGFAAGNNLAAREARGRYLIFLNQDAIVHKSWLRALIEAMETHPKLGACQANMIMPWCPEFDRFEREKYPGRVYYADIHPYGFITYQQAAMREDIIPTRFITGASFIVRREALARMPYLFDPRFVTGSEDLDFSLRLQALGFGAAVAPRAVMYHLQYSELSNLHGALRKAYLSVRNRFLAHYKHLPLRRFLAFLPKLFVGSFLKMGELRFGGIRRVALWGAMLLVSVAALIGAAWMMPAYGGYKKRVKLCCKG